METELEEQEEDAWINIFSSAPFFKNIKFINYDNYKPRFKGVFLRPNLLRIKDSAY